MSALECRRSSGRLPTNKVEDHDIVFGRSEQKSSVPLAEPALPSPASAGATAWALPVLSEGIAGASASSEWRRDRPVPRAWGQALALLSSASVVLTTHGKDSENEVVYLGGLHTTTRASLRTTLKLNGYEVYGHSDSLLQSPHQCDHLGVAFLPSTHLGRSRIQASKSLTDDPIEASS